MNSIIIQGGLGNQLFQIFMLMSYSIKHNKPFVIPKNMQSWDKRNSYWDSIFCNLTPFLVEIALLSCCRQTYLGFWVCLPYSNDLISGC